MKNVWPLTRLGDILIRADRFELRDDFVEYQFAGTYSYARGIFVSERKIGGSFGLPKIQRIRENDFVYCKIMAWEGAFGIVPKEADSCVMSGAFVAYTAVPDKVLPSFLANFFKLKKNWQKIGGQSSGTNVRRQSLHPDDFENFEISLPTIAEQKRIVARIEAIQLRLHAADQLRKLATAELHALCRALVLNDPSTKQLLVGDVVQQKPLNVNVEPDKSYQFAGVYSFGRGVFKGGTKTGAEFAYPKLSRIKAEDFIYPKLMAWEGALGVVPNECDGCVVSPEFPVFEIDKTKVLPDVFDVYFRDPSTWESLQGGSTGTNVRRRRLNPTDFLKLKIPVPSMATQRKLATIRLHQRKINSINPEAGNSAVLASLLNKLLSQ